MQGEIERYMMHDAARFEKFKQMYDTRIYQ